MVTHRHSYRRPASEQCKATHPVCVTSWPLGPCPPDCLYYPDWISTTQLQRWPSFIWTDPSYQVCQFWRSHTHTCNQPLLPFPLHLLHSTLPQLHTCQISLVSFSCVRTHLKPHAVGNHADSMFTGSATSRVECQGPTFSAWGQEIRLCGGWLIQQKGLA